MVKTDLLSHGMLLFPILPLCLHSVRIHALSRMLGAHLAGEEDPEAGDPLLHSQHFLCGEAVLILNSSVDEKTNQLPEWSQHTESTLMDQ